MMVGAGTCTTTTEHEKMIRTAQRKILGLIIQMKSEDTTQESLAQDPSLRTCSQPDYIQPPTAQSQSTYHFPPGLW